MAELRFAVCTGAARSVPCKIGPIRGEAQLPHSAQLDVTLQIMLRFSDSQIVELHRRDRALLGHSELECLAGDLLITNAAMDLDVRQIPDLLAPRGTHVELVANLPGTFWRNSNDFRL